MSDLHATGQRQAGPLSVESPLARVLLVTLPLAFFGYFLSLAPAIGDGEQRGFSYQWIALLDIAFSMRVDGLALLFALLITGIGSLVVLYAGEYLKGHERLGRFYLLLMLFLFSMLGLVLADNLITLFVFWELTSITSFGRIGFESEKPPARAAALQALLVTGGGGLALLAGLLLIGVVAGTQSISTIVSSDAALLGDSSLYPAIVILVCAGAFTKSAQVPFHFWLPNAMEAPTPVSAFLHSATMVKAGVYLLARFSPALGGGDLWTVMLVGFGCATMIMGALMALRESDLKRILAYLTLSILGTLVLLIGIGTDKALLAAMVLLLTQCALQGCSVPHSRHHRSRNGNSQRRPARRPPEGHAGGRGCRLCRRRLDGRGRAVPTLSGLVKAVMLAAFGFLTSPIAAHMVGRAAYAGGEPLWEGTLVDQMKDHSTTSTPEIMED